MTPFVLQCGRPLLPISLAQLPLTSAAEVPTKDDCDALLTEMDAVTEPRLIVLGTDASLAAVLTRLMRTERLHIEVAFVPQDASDASALYHTGTGSRAAKVALSGTASATPLIRDDTGSALVGRATVSGPQGSLVGEAYVDDTRLFSGTVMGIEVSPTLEMPGLRARVQGKRGLFRRRWISGRAIQLGATAARLTKDGVTLPRDTTRSTMYRHDKEWLLVR